MTGFDFVFALFSLLLGLGVAETMAGFSRVMKLHASARAGRAKDVRVGWLTPLLAVLIILNQLSFWMMAYSLRETLPLTYFTLLGVTIIVGAYYLFSSLVFPDDPGEWPDFDIWYDQNNRFILIGMIVINIAAGIASGRYAPPRSAAQQAAASGDAGLVALVALLIDFALMIALIWVRSRRVNIALMLLLIAFNLIGAAAFLMSSAAP